MLALGRAEAELRAGLRAALILAVDCQIGPETLLWLEAGGRLHGAHGLPSGGRRAEPYGRVPAEGAAAIALCAATGDAPQRLFAAAAEEPIGAGDDRPCTGEGLTAAARRALRAAGDPPVQGLYTDLNGEPYRADEFGFTSLRLGNALRQDLPRQTPALVSGDLGAASLVTHLTLACRRATPGAQLLLASSDDPLRAALVLHTKAGS